ncbi:MAG TPA: alpha/beta hydrolase [Pirellulales bacterium]|jgi:pimeloyl-ACP methyl ester carboxylesterase
MPRRPLILVAILLFAFASAVRAEDTSFDSDGVKIHYIVEGEGEPVLLIHGFAANIPMQWGLPGVIKELSKEYQVIAIDNRGHGRSGKPHDPKDYGQKMVDDAVRLLDHLKIKKAHVVGYSMGGFLTNKLIATHPDRVISATLGGAGWEKANDERMSFMKELAESLETGKGIGPLIEMLAPEGTPKPTKEQIDGINTMLMFTNDQKALAAVVRGMPEFAVTEETLKANKTPTLAIIGEIDPLKAGVDEMEQVMANLKVVVIDGADHMTAFNKPEFLGSLKPFLAEHSMTKAKPAKEKEPVAVGAGAGK